MWTLRIGVGDDLASRALVLGVPGPDHDPAAVLAAGADLVEIDGQGFADIGGEPDLVAGGTTGAAVIRCVLGEAVPPNHVGLFDATGFGPAEVALAVTRGCRVIRTRDVRATRRVVDVLAAVLERRVGTGG